MSIAVLGKAADVLVEQAVLLSVRSGLPKVIIGATIVSLGTTLPEVAVSVLAAFQGSPGLALGNAVGSIICDTGLILGIATIINPPPLNKDIVNRQGWLQLGSGVLLVICCLPFSNLSSTFIEGGRLPQVTGWVFMLLLGAYIYFSIRWARNSSTQPEETIEHTDSAWPIIIKLIIAAVFVIAASDILIHSATEAARRLAVPESVIAATLVAFGTSLPELVTAISAVRRNHGEIAIGNIIGADILNVLFVAGAAASVTPAGLIAGPHFFTTLFPGMLIILTAFRLGIFFSGKTLHRGFGFALLGIYILISVISYQ